MKLWPSKKEKEKEYPKEGEIYEFLDLDGVEKITAVKIIKGKFEGVVYHYGKIKVIDENPPKIEFDFFIDDPGKFIFEDLLSNKKFDTLMGDIIVSIFDKNILNPKKDKDDEVGTDDSEEFNIQ